MLSSPSAHTAILWSGGGGSAPVVVTITEDISLPINVVGDTYFIRLVVKDAFGTAPGIERSPQTVYGTPGSIEFEWVQEGTTISANYYNTFGSIEDAFGEVGNKDFVMVFFMPYAVSLTIGDQFVLRAGSVTLDAAIPLPTNAAAEIFATDSNGLPITGSIPIPEPSTTAILLMGPLLIGASYLRRSKKVGA